jgi:hypothetical protein
LKPMPLLCRPVMVSMRWLDPNRPRWNRDEGFRNGWIL